MKLIMSPTSPYVRKVRVMIRETNLMDAVEEVEVATTAYAPDATAVSKSLPWYAPMVRRFTIAG